MRSAFQKSERHGRRKLPFILGPFRLSTANDRSEACGTPCLRGNNARGPGASDQLHSLEERWQDAPATVERRRKQQTVRSFGRTYKTLPKVLDFHDIACLLPTGQLPHFLCKPRHFAAIWAFLEFHAQGLKFAVVSTLAVNLSDSTQATLLARLADPNDQEAWREFIAIYAPQVFAWARRYGVQHSDADDVTQIVLGKLVRAMQTFQYDPAKGRFRSWLRTVTTNAVRSFAVSDRREDRGAGGTSIHQQIAALQDSRPLDDLYAVLDKQAEREMLAAAEERVRLRVKPANWMAWQKTVRDGLSPAQAAEELKLTPADSETKADREGSMADALREPPVNSLNDCPDEAALRGLLGGDFDGEENLSVGRHVDVCEKCQNRLDDFYEASEASRDISLLTDSEYDTHPIEGVDRDHLRQFVQKLSDNVGDFIERWRVDEPSPAPVIFPGAADEDAPLDAWNSTKFWNWSVPALRGFVQGVGSSAAAFVAIKVWRMELAALESARTRFVREAHAVAQFQSDHIAAIHEVNTPDDFPPWLVLQFVAGESLSSQLKRDGHLTPREAAAAVVQILDALAEAHAGGVVHRDVKPSNVLVEFGSRSLKLVDFGLAR
ncbi:hypothetical protein Pcinc_023995 [Petrolisthes cinctipes]|uniref:Protein kinase domain-containing protein n=1 Tax=Petrolisthes cinctipes TaxID=88211 RepID=A0AAE1FCA7_PETCI|nr:hypothetical protein Pcinc_023995 [Petrolisthes cinctipes]